METIIKIFHLFTAFAIIGLVLLDRGRGADAGASFGGGASQTVMGSEGSNNVISKVIAWVAAFFFATSLGLAYFANEKSKFTDDLLIPEVVETPVLEESDLPVVTEEISAHEELPAAEAPKPPEATDASPEVEPTEAPASEQETPATEQASPVADQEPATEPAGQ